MILIFTPWQTLAPNTCAIERVSRKGNNNKEMLQFIDLFSLSIINEKKNVSVQFTTTEIEKYQAILLK